MESANKSFSAFGSLFSTASDSLLTLFYPQICRICEKSVEYKTDGFVCGECWQNTRVFDENEIVCRKCSAFLISGFTDSEVFCHQCDADEYDLARCVGLYENALAISVWNLKHQPFIPQRLRNLIRNSFNTSPFQDTNLIIPVPLSTRRRRERGFNQATIIAQVIAEYKNLPLDELSLKRVVHTEKHRAGMDKKARYESVRNAFEVKRPRLIKNKNILLVDDIFTSGATVSNCAKVLKKGGANKIYVLTIARAF